MFDPYNFDFGDTDGLDAILEGAAKLTQPLDDKLAQMTVVQRAVYDAFTGLLALVKSLKSGTDPMGISVAMVTRMLDSLCGEVASKILEIDDKTLCVGCREHIAPFAAVVDRLAALQETD
jgi:hypothetical protein